jgi:hypothetical protein
MRGTTNLDLHEYNEESNFCCRCTSDHWLKARIQKFGLRGSCCVCQHEREYVIKFKTLGEWIEEIWIEWFRPGKNRSYFFHDWDKIHYEQRGDEPQLLISEVVKCRHDEERVVNRCSKFSGTEITST